MNNIIKKGSYLTFLIKSSLIKSSKRFVDFLIYSCHYLIIKGSLLPLATQRKAAEFAKTLTQWSGGSSREDGCARPLVTCVIYIHGYWTYARAARLLGSQKSGLFTSLLLYSPTEKAHMGPTWDACRNYVGPMQDLCGSQWVTCENHVGSM